MCSQCGLTAFSNNTLRLVTHSGHSIVDLLFFTEAPLANSNVWSVSVNPVQQWNFMHKILVSTFFLLKSNWLLFWHLWIISITDLQLHSLWLFSILVWVQLWSKHEVLFDTRYQYFNVQQTEHKVKQDPILCDIKSVDIPSRLLFIVQKI